MTLLRILKLLMRRSPLNNGLWQLMRETHSLNETQRISPRHATMRMVSSNVMETASPQQWLARAVWRHQWDDGVLHRAWQGTSRLCPAVLLLDVVHQTSRDLQHQELCNDHQLQLRESGDRNNQVLRFLQQHRSLLVEHQAAALLRPPTVHVGIPEHGMDR